MGIDGRLIKEPCKYCGKINTLADSYGGNGEPFCSKEHFDIYFENSTDPIDILIRQARNLTVHQVEGEE